MTKHLSGVDTRPVVLIALAVAFSLLGDVTIYVVLPIYHHALGFSPIQVGILLSANRWIRLATNQFARHVLDHHHARNVLAVALIAGAVATLGYASAPPFWLFLAARVAWGVCWSFIRHVGVMASIGVGSGATAGAIMGLYNGVVQVGFIGGTVAGALLFDSFGYSVAFLFAAFASLAAVPFDFAGFECMPYAATVPYGRRPHTAVAADHAMLVRSFIAACVGTGLVISTLGFALRSRFGDSIAIGSLAVGVTTLNGILIAVHYAVNSVGSPPIGIAIDRIGRRSAETLGFGLGGMALAGAALWGESPLFVPVILLFFVATVACKLSLISQAGVSGSRRFARVITASDLGAAAGPLIGWFAIDRLGSPDAVFVTGAALYALAALLSARPAAGSRGPGQN